MFGGGSDPYVIVLADPPELLMKDSKLQTEIINHNLNPIWDGPKNVLKLHFRTDDYNGICDNAHIFFSVWDSDQITEDDLIGIFPISLKDIVTKLRAAVSFDFDQQLISNGEIMGDLAGTITCVDHNGQPCLLPPESSSLGFGTGSGRGPHSFKRQQSMAVPQPRVTLAEAAVDGPSVGACCTIV